MPPPHPPPPPGGGINDGPIDGDPSTDWGNLSEAQKQARCESIREQIQVLQDHIAYLWGQLKNNLYLTPEQRIGYQQQLTSAQDSLSSLVWQSNYLCGASVPETPAQQPSPNIVGIEVTQAIQYYHSDQHLSDSADRMPDNSVRLIANKPAWVRVYVRSPHSDPVQDVTGVLEVLRQSANHFELLDTLQPQPPGTVIARTDPPYHLERGDLSFTLNFVIPKELMWGALLLRAIVSAPDALPLKRTETIHVNLKQTLKLRGVMIGYDGPSWDGTKTEHWDPPTLSDLQDTAAITALIYPLGDIKFENAGSHMFNKPLKSEADWNELSGVIQKIRSEDLDADGWVYYGLMNGVPKDYSGRGGGGIAIGSKGAPWVMAEEVGHAIGPSHAPCGPAPTPDPDYPAYEPYDTPSNRVASIGEYGLDTSTGDIKPPDLFHDFMGYCEPWEWVSLYHYNKLVYNSFLHPETIGVDGPQWHNLVADHAIQKALLQRPAPEAVVSIIGVVRDEDEVEVISVRRVDAVLRGRPGRKTALKAELLSADGQVLARAPLYRLPPVSRGGCGCSGVEADESGESFVFQAFVPNVAPGAALRIRDGEKELWHRKSPAAELRIARFRKSTTRQTPEGHRLDLNWQIETAPGTEHEGWLQWSNDEGHTWHGLAAGLRGQSVVLDTAPIPPGAALVRLLASDGFHTTVSRPITVDIPRRTPAVSIFNPRPAHVLVAGSTLRLWGVGTRDMGGPVADAQARWMVDGRDAGTGLDVFTVAPPAGEHVVTLVVVDEDREAERTVQFATVAKER